MADARAELARIELAIARGEPWEPEPEVIDEDMGPLLKRCSVSLKNRKAYEDRLIIARDLVPRWKAGSWPTSARRRASRSAPAVISRRIRASKTSNGIALP
jgi:hypothetical protein